MPSNTQTGLSIVGQIVGAYYGGAIGGYLGGLVGGIVGGAIDPAVVEGPHLGDLNVRASTYGRPIPLIYGRENRIGGNVIWTNGIKEHEKKDGNFYTGYVVSYYYTASFAVALGQGTMRNISAIYANGKLLWSKAKMADRLAKAKKRKDAKEAYCASVGIDLATCDVFDPSADFLDGYDLNVEMPDFEPWMLAGRVDIGSDGYGVLHADDNRRATLFQGGEFTQLEWFPGTNDQPQSLIIGHPPAYRGTAYMVFKDLRLARFGNQIPTIEVVVSGQRQETVDQILADIADRAGANLDEVVPRGALSKFFVRGYTVSNARSAFAAIVPLMQVYPFDSCDHAGTVRFTPRRRTPYATIRQDEMGARIPDEARQSVFPIERIANYELPSEASFTYVDPANGYQAGTQIATRAAGNSQSKLNLSAPITMTSGEASRVAHRMLWEPQLTREQIKPVKVSERYDWYQPGDLVAVPVPGAVNCFRVLGIDRGDNGIIEWSVAREDAIAYDGDLPGGDPTEFPQDEPDYDATVAALFNAPMLSSADDNAGFTYAMDSEGNWPEATLYRSVDETASWTVAATTTRRDSISSSASLLPAGPTDIWDRVNVLTIELLNAHDPPESATEQALLGSPTLNLLWLGAADGSDGELLQFATVTEVSDGLYELSNLLRGRRATEYYVDQHATDDVAVLLRDVDLAGSINYGQGDWNLLRHYVGVSIGQAIEDAIPVGFTATGERLAPRAPVHPSGARDGSNNLTISWIRRNRMFPPPMGYGEVPLGEASEAYEVDILSGPAVVRTILTTSPLAAYSAADQITDGFTPGDPISGRIYQISATRGRGRPASFTV